MLITAEKDGADTAATQEYDTHTNHCYKRHCRESRVSCNNYYIMSQAKQTIATTPRRIPLFRGERAVLVVI